MRMAKKCPRRFSFSRPRRPQLARARDEARKLKPFMSVLSRHFRSRRPQLARARDEARKLKPFMSVLSRHFRSRPTSFYHPFPPLGWYSFLSWHFISLSFCVSKDITDLFSFVDSSSPLSPPSLPVFHLSLNAFPFHSLHSRRSNR